MKILIDADGCPVVDIALEIAKKYQLECIIICDTSHHFDKPFAKTIVVDKGADSVDFKLVNMVCNGDIVITQDYGLAAMCLARVCFVINQDGFSYSNENIDVMLMKRHTSKKDRSMGIRQKGPAKRTALQNKTFYDELNKVIVSRL